MVKQLIDPDALELLTIPTKKEEFVQQLNHNYLVVYDNIKKVPRWFSDEVCRAVTGIGNSKRRLYTDDEDVVYRYKRCILLNGINISLTEPDALDRSILTEVARIPNEERKEWTKVMAEFDQLRPKLLGYMLDILVKALQIKPGLQLKNLPRMADFAIWGEAIARAMGYGEMEFINAYYDNIGKQNIEAIEANPLSQAIAKFCDEQQIENKGQSAWEGSNCQLLEQLQIVADRNGINTSQKKWPKATNSLTKRLNQIRSNLLEGLGICITISRDNKKNTSIIRIEKKPPIPPEPPKDENQAQNKHKNIGGTLTCGGSIPPIDKEPPTYDLENQAQKTDSGGIGGSGGILSTIMEGQGRQANDDEEEDEKRNIMEHNNNNHHSLSSITESKSIYRLGHSDTFGCHNCKQKGDKWFIEKHFCQGLK
jgi:hypothetical protein